jgi:transcriptional regulator with XRE-family HTH domain
MGTKQRPRPKRLAAKLVAIRNSFNLSQNELVERLGMDGVVRSTISSYERGVREPPYLTLLKYARLAGVSTDVLIDDDLDLR